MRDIVAIRSPTPKSLSMTTLTRRTFAGLRDATPAFVKGFADPQQTIPPIGEVGAGVRMRIVATGDPRPALCLWDTAPQDLETRLSLLSGILPIVAAAFLSGFAA